MEKGKNPKNNQKNEKDTTNQKKEKKFFTAKYDRVFKTVFVNEDNPALLQKFLSYLLEEDVEIIEFLREEQPVLTVETKVKTVDLLVKIKGKYVLLELNTDSSIANRTRNFNYFTSIYDRKTSIGEKYDFKTKFIHIDLSYNMPSSEPLKSSYFIQNDLGTKYINNFEIIVYNMDKAMNYWYNGDTENIDKYKYLIMLDLEKKSLKKLSKGDDFVSEFEKKVTSLNKRETFQRLMSAEKDLELLHNAQKELCFDNGVLEGRKQGIEQGSEQTKIETAKNLLDLNVDIDKIVKATGLSLEQVNSLKNNDA